MKIIWHITKKDFRQLWPLLALWWGVLALRALDPAMDFSAHLPNAPTGQFATQFNRYRSGVLMAADLVLLVIVAASAVRVDSPIKPGMHWRQLPVSGGRVFSAKILFFILFCGLPAALINLVAKMEYGYPPALWRTGLTWYEWKIAVCIAVGVMAAALFRRAFLTPLTVVIVYSFIIIVYELPFLWFLQGYGDSIWDTLYLTRFLLWSNVLIASALGAAGFMYMTRRHWRSRLILAAGLVCAQFLQGYWPYDFFDQTDNAFAYSPAPQELTFPVSFSSSTLQLTSRNLPQSRVTINAIFRGQISGVHSHGPGEAWILDGSDWNLPMADGHLIKLSAGRWPAYPENYAEALQTMGLEKLQPYTSDFMAGSWGAGQTNLKSLAAEPPGDQPKKLTGHLKFLVGPLTRIADVPLAKGAQFKRNPDCFAIQQIRVVKGASADNRQRNNAARLGPPSETVVIDLLAQSMDFSGAPLIMFDPHWQWDQENVSNGREYFFVLWNPKRQEVVPAQAIEMLSSPYDQDEYGETVGNGLLSATFTRQIFFEFYHPTAAIPWRPLEIQQWLADARLVELSFTPEHSYSVPANIDNLQVANQVAATTPTPPTP